VIQSNSSTSCSSLTHSRLNNKMLQCCQKPKTPPSVGRLRTDLSSCQSKCSSWLDSPVVVLSALQDAEECGNFIRLTGYFSPSHKTAKTFIIFVQKIAHSVSYKYNFFFLFVGINCSIIHTVVFMLLGLVYCTRI